MFHVDLYRLADATDVLGGGLLDDRLVTGRHADRVARATGRGDPARTPRRRDRGLRRRAARDRADRPRRAPRALPRGARMTCDAPATSCWPSTPPRPGSSWPSARSTASPAQPRAGPPGTATARRCCPPSSGCWPTRASGGRGSRRSSSARGRGRSPACASGIATAKGLAHGLGRPIVGIPTGAALLAAARGVPRRSPAGRGVLLLPAGPSDRVVVRDGRRAEPAPGGPGARARPATTCWSRVDLEGRAPDDALARGETAPRRPRGRAPARSVRPAWPPATRRPRAARARVRHAAARRHGA